MDKNGGTEKERFRRFQFESDEDCFSACNITQAGWCENIEVGVT